MITVKEFTMGWKHFLSRINFDKSYLDGMAVRFMNEMPVKLLVCIKQRRKLLNACKAQHRAIDNLFALLIAKNGKFLPSESGQPWKALIQGNKVIENEEK